MSAETFTVRIEAKHFVAGVDIRGDVVVHAADILGYMRGWTADRVRTYCTTKGWRARRLP